MAGKPKMKKVDSDSVQSMSFQVIPGNSKSPTGVLLVRYKNSGGLYRYSNVPEKLYNVFIQVEKHNRANLDDEDHISLGSLLHYTIKADPTKYPYVKLEETDA